ncbi:hypothetical protein M5I08_05250 [Candidatus Mycobacterium methanotrophicum]|uniref:DNA-binding domain-containing protein n=1 Tax=Candidatus Mycobacterium methanotrophicum TaxID=2943498 RepID=A0ABY4QNE0_9MYCO|nr:hypothetical protein [Candidatus Mycobacterium methanotrophicum]UQX11828.1 hypothetical protein M5I08_05250 [Candidatus Mycobacterium methanotrophicum]
MIAASLRVCAETVRKWRRRWCAAPGAASLGGAKRCGRPPVFTAAQIAQVKAAARIPPADAGLACPETGPLRHHERNLRFDLIGHHRPLAVRGRAQTPAAAAIPRSRPGWRARCGSTTTTTVAARWLTWQPTTCTARMSSAAAKTPPASSRLPGSPPSSPTRSRCALRRMGPGSIRSRSTSLSFSEKRSRPTISPTLTPSSTA